MSKVFAIIPNAGTGSRFSNTTPKQYYPIIGKPVIEWTLQTIALHPHIDNTIVVTAAQDSYEYHSIQQKTPNLRIIKLGGETRAETVRKGLNYLMENFSTNSEDLIMIHDAARCCLHPTSINLLIEQFAIDKYLGAILAAPITDSIKYGSKNDLYVSIDHIVLRDNLYTAQTPQLFLLHSLKEKLINPNFSTDHTDEASLFNEPDQIQIIINHKPNPKLTSMTDLPYIEYLLNAKTLI